MTDFRHLYFLLFNKITDAIEKIDARNPQEAKRILISAQLEAEKTYVEAED